MGVVLPSMKRRTLLRTVGVAVGAGTLAGCLDEQTAAPGTEPGGAGGTDPGTRTTDRPDEGTTDRPEATPDEGTGTSTSTEPAEFGTDADDPFETITVGSREGVANPDDNRPHGVNVWNAAERERTLTVAVRRGSATVLEETITFPADGYLSMTLAEPGDYRLPIRTDGAELGVVTVARSRFDCNSSYTNVDVTPDDELRSTVVSTMMACETTGVTDRSFESEEGTCTSGATEDGTATVSFTDDAVAVDGAIVAPNPCHRATLLDVSEAAGTTTVTVGAVDARETGTACVECVGSVGYHATFGEEVALTDRVTVVHSTHRGERTVATAER